ncbi:MAG: peptide chain release factor family protein [Akkermansiaceae bacterium]
MPSPEKWKALEARMLKLGILAEDLTEKFIRGSGSGGQKINKTASCVYLKHTPSGIEVKCQAERSRELNRFIARKELCETFQEKILGIQSARQQAREKIRRQKRRRSRRQKNRMLDDKSKQGEKKQRRQKPNHND